MKPVRCEQCAKRVVTISLCTNTILAVIKIFVGIASGSKACVADGLHSSANIITSLAIVVSHRIGRKEASDRFPYGYGKVEFVAAGFVSLLIIGGAIALIVVSIKHLLHEPSGAPHYSAMLMGLISVCANEMVFRYMRCVGTQFKSQTVLASAWASRADCFSSIAVVLGVAGAKLGFHHLDPITALVVVAVIIKMSTKILGESIKALMDSSVNHVYSDQIEAVVRDIEQVHGISELMTRHVGQKIWVEMEIQVNSQCTLQEGQMITERVRQGLLGKVKDLEQILIRLGPMEGEG